MTSTAQRHRDVNIASHWNARHVCWLMGSRVVENQQPAEKCWLTLNRWWLSAPLRPLMEMRNAFVTGCYFHLCQVFRGRSASLVQKQSTKPMTLCQATFDVYLHLLMFRWWMVLMLNPSLLSFFGCTLFNIVELLSWYSLSAICLYVCNASGL